MQINAKEAEPASFKFFSVEGYDFKEQSYYAGISSSDICKDKKPTENFTTIYSDGSTGKAEFLPFRKTEIKKNGTCLIRFKLDQSKTARPVFVVVDASVESAQITDWKKVEMKDVDTGKIIGEKRAKHLSGLVCDDSHWKVINKRVCMGACSVYMSNTTFLDECLLGKYNDYLSVHCYSKYGQESINYTYYKDQLVGCGATLFKALPFEYSRWGEIKVDGEQYDVYFNSNEIEHEVIQFIQPNGNKNVGISLNADKFLSLASVNRKWREHFESLENIKSK
ncbi:MAG: hypothetical protein COW01_07450 [Bdellovibrionales bacterium CG12_big_fil_rev_8_21_14_0_65_38_15]|nr:MAG: hypothetical protein COW01_07450 [Bdellovibrionales bacterium CG12_big_fil_rev_8_21_14_0_65_38_15]PIR29747.1 MAG: hypothetical protein COV38_09090 [Bdellovibrionales bacterium CG11_big_fil_rev_8_21_14_0_20_38_13]